MITERQFASGYSSFWRELLPGADRFIRRVNLTVKRFAYPIDYPSSADRGLVNETAFRLFSMDPSCTNFASLDTSSAFASAQEYIKRFREFSVTSQFAPLTPIQREEVVRLASALRGFVDRYYSQTPLTVMPQFEGCGLVARCEGDILVGETLFEVKAGERTFRNADFRQVLVYLALNHASKSHHIRQFGFVNPRRGMMFRVAAEEACLQVSGLSAVEIYEEIADFLCEEGMATH